MLLVHLKDRFVEYKFGILNKYTLIQGDSATGKTTLYDLVAEYEAHPMNIQCSGHSSLRVVPNTTNLQEASAFFKSSTGTVFFIDEDDQFLRLRGCEKVLKQAEHYFVIIFRYRKFNNFLVSLDSICRIKTSGRFHTLVPLYNTEQKGVPDCVITEDSKCGNKFLKEVFQGSITILHSGEKDSTGSAGKNKLASMIRSKFYDGMNNIAVVFDRAGIGIIYSDIMELKIHHTDLNLYEIDWESFEYYILASKVYGDDFNDYDYHFESLEQCATEHMQRVVFESLGSVYSKGVLPVCLTRNRYSACKNKHHCHYSRFIYDDLVYGKVAALRQRIKKSMVSTKLIHCILL